MQISRALRRMLCCQYSQRSPGYKSEFGYLWETPGHADSIKIRIRDDVEILNPERKLSCGFKNTAYVERGLSTLNLEYLQPHLRKDGRRK